MTVKSRLTKPISRCTIICSRLITTSTMSEYSDEIAVGIVAHTNTCPGFSGILKQRYSDFIVREISKYGEVARFNSIDGSLLEQSCFQHAAAEFSVSDDSVAVFVEQLMSHGHQASAEKEILIDFVTKATGREGDCPPDLVAACCPDKATRTAVHRTIKACFPSYIDSDTVTLDGLQWVRLIAKHKIGKGAKKWRDQWPKNVGDYLQFKIIKENVDTISAVTSISNVLKCKNDAIKFAGTKDKRAVTVQWATMYRMKPSTFSRLNAFKYYPIIRFGDFSYVQEPMRLGDLNGNRFEIVLRDVQSPPEVVERAVEAVKASGFVNYFGLQRFGRGGSGSHLVGRDALRGDWRGVVEQLFTTRSGERTDIVHGKQLALEGKYEEAKKLLPRGMYSEHLVLDGLLRDPTNFNAAYMKVPRSTRLICLHAFQSFIWNLAASHRVNTFGLEVVSGDVVLEYSGAVADASEDRSSAEDDDAVVIENGIEDIADSPARKQSVHVVTPDDIADRKFTMSDVVLPLVSHDSIFPTHPTGEYIHTLLAESGISMEMFNAQKGTLGGAYRRVVGFPQDMTWRCQRYSHGDEEIATTELAALKPPSERSTTPTVSGGGAGGDVESGDGSVDKKYLAAVIEFSLPSGTYATMLLRELMKFNTNSSHHAALTAANEAEDSLNQGSSEKLGVADLESANKSDDASDAMASPSKRLRLS